MQFLTVGSEWESKGTEPPALSVFFFFFFGIFFLFWHIILQLKYPTESTNALITTCQSKIQEVLKCFTGGSKNSRKGIELPASRGYVGLFILL